MRAWLEMLNKTPRMDNGGEATGLKKEAVEAVVEVGVEVGIWGKNWQHRNHNYLQPLII